MSQSTDNLRALLGTLVFLVLGVVRVANSCANMAAIQSEFARLSAPPLRGLFKVFGTGGCDFPIGMILTVQGQSIPDLVLFAQGVEDVAPQFDLFQHCTVSDTVKAFLGAGQGDADAIWNVQKPDFAFGVAADQRQENNIILLTLVLVHHMNLDPCELVGGHEVAQTIELASIGGEDCDLMGLVVL